jgi:hypothetical protein
MVQMLIPCDDRPSSNPPIILDFGQTLFDVGQVQPASRIYFLLDSIVN